MPTPRLKLALFGQGMVGMVGALAALPLDRPAAVPEPQAFANDGAGMARVTTAARFVHGNMPLGATFEAPVIPPQDAFDVMAFVNAQPRPHREGLEADYPDRSAKPVDAPYPPFIGPFPPDQHRFGPWGPIQEWLRANPAAARAVP